MLMIPSYLPFPKLTRNLCFIKMCHLDNADLEVAVIWWLWLLLATTTTSSSVGDRCGKPYGKPAFDGVGGLYTSKVDCDKRLLSLAV